MTALEIGIIIFFFCGTFILTAVNNAFRSVKKRVLTKQLNNLGRLFSYRYLHHALFPFHEHESLIFATTYSVNIARFCYTASIILALANMAIIPLVSYDKPSESWLWTSLAILGALLLLLSIGDLLPRFWGSHQPERVIRLCGPLASPYLYLFFPLSYPFLKISDRLIKTMSVEQMNEPIEEVREHLFDLIKEAGLHSRLDPTDKKLLESVVTFRDRIAREIMVPRLEVFSINADMPISQAVRQLEQGGYSRVPIYRQSVDNIVGVLMYKDILTKYIEFERKGADQSVISIPVGTIAKPVIYVPETKPISSLLQQFRNKQIHLAIVVDEYGSTAGIITIEDILEEIVGEISDETDKDLPLFQPQSSGDWIVDARMGLLDVEEQMGIKIPQDGDYDTITGYIFYRTGMIPPKGFVIQHDDFEIEVLDSNDRSVDKVRIIPRIKSNEADDYPTDW